MHPLRTYRIETDRLTIRCCEPRDAALMLESMNASREHLLPWMIWAANPISLEERIAFLQTARANYDTGKDGMMVILDRTETVFIGCTGFHYRSQGNAVEIGYWLDVRQTGNGFITESTAALTQAGFEIEGFNRIEIHCSAHNLRSAKIPQRLGFTYEGILRQRLMAPTGPVDEMVYAMLKSEYEQSQISLAAFKAYDVVGREIAV